MIEALHNDPFSVALMLLTVLFIMVVIGLIIMALALDLDDPKGHKRKEIHSKLIDNLKKEHYGKS
jgi:hypothetical protein